MSQKLRKTVINGNENKVVDYLDGFQIEERDSRTPKKGRSHKTRNSEQYAGNVLQFFPTAEGYVKATKVQNSYSFNYVFNYTDHLGNIRLSYTKNPENGVLEIMDETHYYPFGLKHEVYIPALKQNFVNLTSNQIALTNVTETDYQYKYQGQERQDELGLNWDSFKWRNYDFAIGRFMSIDPLTEEYHTWSPYVFSGNRVVDARELEGLEPHSVHNTLDAAATNFAQQYNGWSIRNNTEVGTMFYKITVDGNTVYSYNTPVTGTQGNVDVEQANDYPENYETVGSGHTHGDDANSNVIFDKRGEMISDAKAKAIGSDNFKVQGGNNTPSPDDLAQTGKFSRKYSSFEADYTVTPSGLVQKTIPNKNTGQDVTNKNVNVLKGATNTTPSDPNSTIRQNNVDPGKDPEVMPKEGTVKFLYN